MKMKVIAMVAGGALLSLGLAGNAAADEALATAKGCMACHKVDTKLVGPAYKEVAAKYKGDATAEDKLVTKVLEGGVGVWGQVPMIPNKATTSPEEARTLVKWVLSL
jgi:cytochrome c